MPRLERTSACTCFMEAYESVDATGLRAAQLLERRDVVGALKSGGATKLSVGAVVADMEFQSQGRFGRHWHSVPGGSLVAALTVLVPRVVVEDSTVQGWLTPLGSLSLLRGLNAVLRANNVDAESLELTLKWPNDLYCRGMKLGSVHLDIANVPDEPDYVALIYSLGLNLSVRAEFLPMVGATSLGLHAPAGLPEFEELRDGVIAETMFDLGSRLMKLVQRPDNTVSELFAQMNVVCHMNGWEYTFHLQNGGEVTGCVSSLNQDASLTLLTAEGCMCLRTYDVGFAA